MSRKFPELGPGWTRCKVCGVATKRSGYCRTHKPKKDREEEEQSEADIEIDRLQNGALS